MVCFHHGHHPNPAIDARLFETQGYRKRVTIRDAAARLFSFPVDAHHTPTKSESSRRGGPNGSKDCPVPEPLATFATSFVAQTRSDNPRLRVMAAMLAVGFARLYGSAGLATVASMEANILALCLDADVAARVCAWKCMAEVCVARGCNDLARRVVAMLSLRHVPSFAAAHTHDEVMLSMVRELAATVPGGFDALVFRGFVVGLPYMSPPARLVRLKFLAAIAPQVGAVVHHGTCMYPRLNHTQRYRCITSASWR